ncbi:MAG: hypothetical protein ACTHX4_09320, partial [Ruoffia tabacinasalis]
TKKARAMQLIDQAKSFMGIDETEPKGKVKKEYIGSNGNTIALLSKLVEQGNQTQQMQQQVINLLVALVNSNQKISEKDLQVMIDGQDINKTNNYHQALDDATHILGRL